MGKDFVWLLPLTSLLLASVSLFGEGVSVGVPSVSRASDNWNQMTLLAYC